MTERIHEHGPTLFGGIRGSLSSTLRGGVVLIKQGQRYGVKGVVGTSKLFVVEQAERKATYQYQKDKMIDQSLFVDHSLLQMQPCG